MPRRFVLLRFFLLGVLVWAATAGLEFALAGVATVPRLLSLFAGVGVMAGLLAFFDRPSLGAIAAALLQVLLGSFFIDEAVRVSKGVHLELSPEGAAAHPEAISFSFSGGVVLADQPGTVMHKVRKPEGGSEMQPLHVYPVVAEAGAHEVLAWFVEEAPPAGQRLEGLRARADDAPLYADAAKDAANRYGLMQRPGAPCLEYLEDPLRERDASVARARSATMLTMGLFTGLTAIIAVFRFGARNQGKRKTAAPR
jgi:hypothetical protein